MVKKEYEKKPYVEDYINPVRKIDIPKIEKGNPIMLTISPSNLEQYQSHTVQHRLNKFGDRYNNIIKPMLRRFLIQYEMSMEITEQLCSEGNKYFPRLHYHIIGVVQHPITLYLELSMLTCKYNIGYHIQLIKSEVELKHYQEYIIKQRLLWEESRYVIVHKEIYKKNK